MVQIDQKINGLYFFRQQTSTSPWIAAPASERERIIAQYRPELVTVLDVSSDFSTDLTADEMESLRHAGPAYADFDGTDGVADATDGFQRFLGKIQDLGQDLDQCRLYASGGRGYHAEIPLACFLPVVPPEGIVGLPAILKEIALNPAIFTDTLDQRVYSGRRGRMWRVPNFRRPSGLYKVPLTPSEALTMTPERYAEVCSSPRFLPPPAPPQLNPQLARLFADARAKVGVKATRKAATAHAVTEMQERFAMAGYPLPPSLLALLSGDVLPRENVGFNQIALQACIVAVAMGVDEDTLINLSRHLIEHHHGDGNKYTTPRKREDALRKVYSSVDGSSYTASARGIRAILPPTMRCNDLRGL